MVTRSTSLEPAALEAFADLLGDPDEQMVAILAAKVASLADADVERLLLRHDIASENCPRALREGMRRRMADRFALLAATSGPRLDLEAAWTLLSHWGRPDLCGVPVRPLIDTLAEEARDRRGLASLDIRDVLEVVFEERGFRGNRAHYEDPGNSLLPVVLQRRLGIPISLCGLVLLVCRRLRIAVRPVGSPGHFLLGVEGRSGELYIDCFGGGTILDRSAALMLLPQGQTSAEPFPVTTTRDMLARMIRNLAHAYGARQEEDRVRELHEMLASLRAAASTLPA